MNAVVLHFKCIPLLISSLLCLFNFFIHSGSALFSSSVSWPTIFVDCNTGIDSLNCGRISNSPCKTLQFVVDKRAQQINGSHAVLSIASGICNEKGMLELHCSKTRIKSWIFIGSNERPKPPTVLQLSAIIISCFVKFLHIHWKNSSEFISFNTLTSYITFEHSLLENSNVQFTGINTNFVILDTSVNNCTSGDPNLPLFLLHTTYSYQAEVFISNSTFSNNLSPIFYAIQLHGIYVRNSIFLKNGIRVSSNGSLMTIGASSVTLEDVEINQTLGTGIEVNSVKHFIARNLVFVANDGFNGSCLLVHRHSNISLVHSFFNHNANPVIYIKDKDNVNIIVKECTFNCNFHDKEMKRPFVEGPDGVNLTFVNCTKEKSCTVRCKSGELLKSDLFCQKCQTGSFSFSQNDSVTSNSCQSCPVGTYTSTTGSTKCMACSEGTYAQKEGSKKCKKCSNEFFTSHAGAESCSEITLEFILVLAVSVPLIIVPLFILIARHVHTKSKRKHSDTSEGFQRLPRSGVTVQ